MLTGNRDPDSIGLMKTKTTGSILALCFFGAALCFADDPQMSISKPNESKSKVTAGTEKIKPTYISLVQFTDKGMQGAKQTDPARSRLGCQGAVDGRDYQTDVLDSRLVRSSVRLRSSGR